MRKAFLQVQVILYLAILVLVILSFSGFLFNIFKKSFELSNTLTEKKNITELLDLIASEPESVFVLRNNRIARYKNNYLYLTPKNIYIERFEITPERIIIQTKRGTYERLKR